MTDAANFPGDVYVPDDIEKISDVQFTESGGAPLTLDVYRLKNVSYDKPQPAIIWLHGGGWMSGGKEQGVERLFTAIRSGFVGVAANYRLSQAALFPAQLHDCKCAVRFLRAHREEFNIAADRIGAWGASAGGHLASLLATTADHPELEGDRGWAGHSSAIQAACSWFGPSDLNLMDKFPPGIAPALESMNDLSAEGRLVGGAVPDQQELVALANPIRYISRSCPPILLMHGAKDNYVPLASSTEFHQRLLDARVDSTLHVIKQGHHNAYLWGDHHIQQVNEFFEWQLREKDARADTVCDLSGRGPRIGEAKPDGSIYAGVSPDTGEAMYVTAKDAPLTYTFNQANKYAANLDAHGHNDWRVPTRSELNVLYNNRAAIGGFDESGSYPAGWYWSSSQHSYDRPWGQRFSDGSQNFNYENTASSLRCVR